MKQIPLDTPILDVYISLAFTGRNEEERKQIRDFAKDNIISVVKELGLTCFFPYDGNSEEKKKGIIDPKIIQERLKRVALTAKVMIVVTDYKAHGVGAEAEMAEMAMIPIIIIHSNGEKISEMITGIDTVKEIIRGDNGVDFRKHLKESINRHILRESDIKREARAFNASEKLFNYITREVKEHMN
ncbi:MAG: hypothetical protein Q8Q23_03425 [bacterium]|nr:hypothetical protein [bacterium]